VLPFGFAHALSFRLSALARQDSSDSPSFIALASGVGHPEKALSDVRRPRARSAQIGGPDCISHTFQVSTYSGEPFASSL
jgi:hypothetical protein